MRDLENILTFSVEDRKSIFDRENNMSLFHYFIGKYYIFKVITTSSKY